MGRRTVGTLIVKATHGRVGKVVVEGVTTPEQFKALADKIAEYIDASIISRSFTTTEGDPIDSLKGGNTDRKAILRYRDNNSMRTKSISIPGFKTGEEVAVMEGEGERVKNTVVIGIIETLGGATGGDVTPLDGYVIQGR